MAGEWRGLAGLAGLSPAERLGAGLEEGRLLGRYGALGPHGIDIGGALGEARDRGIVRRPGDGLRREETLPMDPRQAGGHGQQHGEGAETGVRFSKIVWKWHEARPGISVRPARSITRSSGRGSSS